MELIENALTKPPAAAVVRMLDLADGSQIRTARWPVDLEKAGPLRGTVTICTGRCEFIEKYYDVVGDLLSRGFAVVVFDWRGQGLSTRALKNRQKGHVADFRLYEADLEAVIERILLPSCPRPYFAIGHSMGGAVMIHHASRQNCAFERIVLSAPMVAVHELPSPRHLRRLVGTLSRAGLSGAFVPQGRRAAVFDKGFTDNVLTSDPARFTTMMSIVQSEPRLSIGAPTIGWLDAALRAMLPFEDIEFCRRIRVPILMVVPGADRVISVPAMERFAHRLKAGTLIRIAHARHEILMERNSLRDQFWAAFDAFVPGETKQAIGDLRSLHV